MTTIQIGTATRKKKSQIEWALTHYKLHGRDLTFAEHAYLLEMLLEEHPEQVVMKSAQVGISEMLVILAFWVADELQKTVLYLFPTRGHIGDFVRQRVDPAIDGSQYLKDRVAGKNAWQNKALNTQSASVANIGLKRVGRGFLFFRGTKSRNDLISVPADLLIEDELDEMVIENLPLAEERLAASDLKWIRRVSTPWFPGGPIDRAFEVSDGRRWTIKCDHCGHWQWLDWYRHIVREVDEGKEGITYAPRDESISLDVAKGLAGNLWRETESSLLQDVSAVCEKCNGKADRLARGRWVPANPGRSVVGWHVSRLHSVRKTLASLYHDFMHSQGSANELAIFHRMALGQPYDVAGDGLTRATMEMLAKTYDPDKMSGEFTTCGIDVGSKLNLQVSRYNNGKRVIVYKNAVQSFERVKSIIDTFRVNLVVVDSLPETREVKRFRDEQPHGRVYLASFGLKCEGQAQNETDWLRFDHLNAHVRCDRTMSFDEATHALVAESPKCIFPTQFLSDTDWIDQMCAPRRHLITNNEGKTRAIWDEGGRPDHYRLADIYDYLAMKAVLNKSGMLEPPVISGTGDIAALRAEDEGEDTISDNFDSVDRNLLQGIMNRRKQRRK